jgi:hypothetical protein
VCVPSEITLGKQFGIFLAVFWVGPLRHQRPNPLRGANPSPRAEAWGRG